MGRCEGLRRVARGALGELAGRLSAFDEVLVRGDAIDADASPTAGAATVAVISLPRGARCVDATKLAR